MKKQQLGSMKNSQTMPQLFYTRQDIHEQYLANKLVSAGRALSSGPQKRQRGSKLVPGSQQKQTTSSSDDDDDDDDDDENEDPKSGEQYSSSNQDGRGRSRSGRSRKRRQRSHSAGFFSGCFNIPHLGSILHPSAHHTTGESTSSSSGGGKRSGFLAHLGIRTSTNNRPTISSSQTTGNLRQLDSSSHMNTNEEFTSAIKPSSSTNLNSSGRKHVSFGSNTQPPPQQQATNLQEQQAKLQQHQPTQQPLSQQLQLVSDSDSKLSGSSNTVIMRNYQAHTHTHSQSHSHSQPQQQPQRLHPHPHPHPHPGATSTTTTNTTHPAQPPIYLVSQVLTGRNAVGPSANQPLYSSSSSGGKSANANTSHLPPIMQTVQPYSSQSTSAPTSAATLRQQPTSCLANPLRRPQQSATTVYKRLPAVPMRTQATQTDITAYHLMSGTPPLTSTPNSARLIQTQPDTPCSSATVAPSHSELQSSDETSVLPHSTKRPQIVKNLGAGQENRSKDDGSDEWSVDEDEPEPEPESESELEHELVGGKVGQSEPRRVSKQFSSSSSSSSSKSLSGHVDLSSSRLVSAPSDPPTTLLEGVTPAKSTSGRKAKSGKVMEFSEVKMASEHKGETIDTSNGFTRTPTTVTPPTLLRQSDASIMSQHQHERVPVLSSNDQIDDDDDDDDEAGDDSGKQCSREIKEAQRELRLKNYNGRPRASESGSSTSSETIATIEPPSQFKDDGFCYSELPLRAESPALSLSEASSQTDPPSAGVAAFKLELSRSFTRPTAFTGFPSSDLTTPTPEEPPTPTGTLTGRLEGQPAEGVCQLATESLAGERGRLRGSLAAGEQRRNDFLTLQTDEQQHQHDEQPEPAVSLISDPFEDPTTVMISQQQQHQTSSSQGGSSKRSSTSTLSTRHHSYCSSDDFHQDNLLLAQHQQQQPAVTNQQQLLELLGPANSASCSAELEEIDEILGDNEPQAEFGVSTTGGTTTTTTTGSLSVQNSTTQLQSGEAAPLALEDGAYRTDESHNWIEKKQENENENETKAEIQAGGSLANLARVSEEANRATEEDEEADSFTSGATIKPDCALAGFMMAAGDHKILPSSSFSSSSSSSSSILKAEPSKEIAKIEPAGQVVVVSAGSTALLDGEKALNSSSSLSSVLSKKIKEEESLTSALAPTSATSAVVLNQPHQRVLSSDVGRRLDCTTNIESRKCSSPSRTRSSEEDESLPTTVSELDMDEQLSTPSFVDSYRNRVDQVCELADSMLSQLMKDLFGESEKIEPFKIQQANNEGQLLELSSSSSSDSPTTSLESCPRRLPRPVPPQKPAHLRAASEQQKAQEQREREEEQCSEAAAALAVTATSIAAAALLHQQQQQNEHIKQLVVESLTEDKKEQPEVAATPLAPLPINSLEELDEDSEEFERPRSLLLDQERECDEEEIALRKQMLEINDNASAIYASKQQYSHADSEETKAADQVGVLGSEPENSMAHAGSSVHFIPPAVPSSSGHVVVLADEQEKLLTTSEEEREGDATCGSSCSLASVSQNLDQNNNRAEQVPVDELVASEGPNQPSDGGDDDDDESSLPAIKDPQFPQQVALVSGGEHAIRSQELSTVSELSEEAPTSQQRKHQPIEQLEVAGVEAEGACTVELAEPATELDLAQSEYTLRSQASELEQLSSESAEPLAREVNSEQRHLSDSNLAHDTSPKLTSRSTTLSPLHSRQHSRQQQQLAHDDTMEAISIDEYATGENDEELLDPPAGFSGEPPVPEWPRPPELEQSEVQMLTERANSKILPPPVEEEDEEDENEESSISVSQQGVLVQSLERPASASSSVLNNNGSTQPHHIGPGKSPSTESATDAILEHLSRHHRRTELPGLDEPAPALEQSRSIEHNVSSKNVQSPSSTGSAPSSASASARRESWKRESLSLKSPTEQQPPSSITTTPPQVELPEELAGGEGSSGTIKRRAAPTATRDESENVGQPVEVSSGGSSQSRRGPPLAQMKCLQQPSGSQLTDTSICSSCSCMEQPTELTGGGTVVSIAANEDVAEERGKRLTALNPVAQWMSQEEGTVFTENYWLAHWLYISEHEESEIWRRAIDMTTTSRHSIEEEQVEQQKVAGMPEFMVEVSSTTSERNFSTKYKSITRKMIHRRATLEMYKRIMNNSLRREKRVEINRSNGEFGFRIHGSRPVVVSAIERGTSAETCGLQVGDLIYAINDTNILDMAHSDVVKLAHRTDSCSLVLDLVPTNEFLKTSKYSRTNNKRYEPVVTGYLMRLSPSTAQPLLVELQERMARATQVSAQQRAAKLNEVMRLAWRKRYFVLRSDNCLYWYRSPRDIEPYGGVNLQGFSASLTNEFSEPTYVIRLVKYGIQPHYLGTNNICDIQTWVDAINRAATEANQNDPYMRRTLTLARTPPNQIPEPECSGYLYKFSHKRSGGAHWRVAYFVLKDACLYLFRDQQTDSVSQASAVYYLHGYRVRNKHIEHKKYTFELIPPNRKTIRPIFLMANSETDRKRWIAALEYSIDRWIEIS